MTLPKLSEEIINKTKNDPTVVLFIDTYNKHGLAEQRCIFIKLLDAMSNIPVIIGRAYSDLSSSDLQLYSSTDIGGLLIDGLGVYSMISVTTVQSFNPTPKMFIPTTKSSGTETNSIILSCFLSRPVVSTSIVTKLSRFRFDKQGLI